MGEPPPRLEIWTVATGNVVTLGLVALILSYASGALSPGLSAFGTLPGIAVFGYLWVLTLHLTRWALAAGGLARIGQGELAALVRRGAVAGAGIGAAFVGGLVLVSAGASLVGGFFQPASVAIFLLVGSLLAGLVGAVVGVALVVVDAVLYRVVDAVEPEASGGGRRD